MTAREGIDVRRLLAEWTDETRAAFRGGATERALWIAIAVALATMMFSIAIAQAAVLIAGLIWLFGMYREPAQRPLSSPLLWTYLVFVAARTLAIPTSIDPAASADALRTEIPFHVFFFVMYAALRPEREDRILFLIRLVILAGTVMAVIGLLRLSLGMDERLSSTTAGYYTAGMFLASVFTLAFALGRRRDVFPHRALWMAVCVLLLAALLLTFNRLHWVIAGLAALVIGLLRERRILAVLAALGIVALLTVAPLQERFLQLLDAGGNMSGRDVLWRGAWMIAGDRPLTGFGLRTFHQVFPLFDQIPDKGVGSWHNDYLQVYMDSGLIALLPMVAMLVLGFLAAARAIRRWPRASLQRDAAIALTVMLAGFAIAGGMLDSLLSILFRAALAILGVLGLAGGGKRNGDANV